MEMRVNGSRQRNFRSKSVALRPRSNPPFMITRIYQRSGERGGVLDLLLHEIVEEHHDIRVVDGQLPHHHDVQRHAHRPNLRCFRLPRSYVRSVRVVRLLGRALGRVEVDAPRGVVQ